VLIAAHNSKNAAAASSFFGGGGRCYSAAVIAPPTPERSSIDSSTGGPQVLLRLDDVHFNYGGRSTLSNIGLQVGPGEVVCLLGENGAGKSTLLKLCAGLLTPTVGRVFLGEQALIGMRRAAVASRLAYLPQEAAHVFPFTSLEVVLMGRYARVRGQFEDAKDLRAAETAMITTDVQALRDRPFNQLSGGERQRVHLAQALAQDTPLILLDEPTAGLDPAHALALGRAMAAASENGRSLLFSTHDLTLAARFAQRAILLAQGEVRLSGSTAEVLAQAGPLLGVTLHIGKLPSGEPFVVPT
jgi:iron complex transport system ATP-binding protein